MTILYNQWAEDRATLWMFAEHNGKPSLIEVEAQNSQGFDGWHRVRVGARHYDSRDAGNDSYRRLRSTYKTDKGLPTWATQEWAMRMLTEGMKILDRREWLNEEFSCC